jgi:hypothetical protein
MDSESYKNLLCLSLSKANFTNTIANMSFLSNFAFGNIMFSQEGTNMIVGMIMQSMLDSINVMLTVSLPKLASTIVWKEGPFAQMDLLNKVDPSYIEKQIKYKKSMIAENTQYHNINLHKKEDYFELE